MFVEPYGVKEQNAKYPNNIGKQTEREVRYAMTGEWLNADNAKGGADCKGWQIKTFRATVCYGTDIEHLFVEYADAEGFIFADRENGVLYKMNKAEFAEFAKQFATIDSDTSHKGQSKIRLNQQFKAQRAWLKARA